MKYIRKLPKKGRSKVERQVKEGKMNLKEVHIKIWDDRASGMQTDQKKG